MAVDHFIDTNIFIYHLDPSDQRKQRIASQLIRAAVSSGTGCISSQVVNECLNVFSKLGKVLLSASEVRAYLDDILDPLHLVRPSTDLFREALDIRDRFRVSFYDAAILAAALSAGCTTLFTEDLQDGQVVLGLTIKNPFLEQP